MDKQGLIDVFKDTVNSIETGKYPSVLTSYSIETLLTAPEESLYLNTSNPVVKVENEDCIEIARRYSKLGRTCILNMASHKKPGGGVQNGQRAQEEELSRRSNLVYGLPKDHYPLSDKEAIFTKDVTFFKDGSYSYIEPFICSVITIAALNVSNGIIPNDYEKTMEEKISTMLAYPSLERCEYLVLSAFGCGVFKNDPRFVAEMFKRLIDEGFKYHYKEISFAVLNDHNSVSDNYSVFKSILEN